MCETISKPDRRSDGGGSCLEKDIRSVMKGASGYPPKLQFLPLMPKKLYYRGSLPGDEPAVAIVGARRCTDYGRHQAAWFAQVLAANGVSIISGLARGIDSCAQTAALDAGGRSYAVLGSGVDVCYPPSSRVLYERLLANGGVLSEFAPGDQPISWHFPARNRVISGLADAVLVIEARPSSGSLITANFALDQGRSVYALPGRVTDAYSEGCNQLIAQGAAVALSPDVILEEFSFAGQRRKGGEDESRRRKEAAEEVTPDTAGLSVEAGRVFEKVTGDPRSLEELLAFSGLDPADGAAAVAELLMAGLIEENAFHFYVRAAKKLAR